MKKKNRILMVVILSIIFIPLTYIKLTTAAITVKNDTTYTIAKSPSLNWIQNFYNYDSEKPEDVKDTWYYNRNYEIIHADEITGSERSIYTSLIFSWWIIGGIIIYQAMKVLKIKPIAQ